MRQAAIITDKGHELRVTPHSDETVTLSVWAGSRHLADVPLDEIANDILRDALGAAQIDASRAARGDKRLATVTP